MLTHIAIHNFGLIDRLAVDFGSGLNIFTGETGAGKSILIDALRHCLGERLQPSLIRDRDKPVRVEAVFELTKDFLIENTVFAEYLTDEEPALIISRVTQPDGRSKNKINDYTVTVSRLKELGDRLIDFHGPHDHQMLFSKNSHIAIVDRLTDMADVLTPYRQAYNRYQTLQRQRNTLQGMAEDRDRELEWLTHQKKELEAVPLDPEAYEQLCQERTRLANAEKLYEHANHIIECLDNEEHGLRQSIGSAFSAMNSLAGIDDSIRRWQERLERIQEESEDLLTEMKNYLSGLSFDPGKVEDINTRYDVYYEILRKFGPGIEDASRKYEEISRQHETLLNLEHNDAELRKEITACEEELKAWAKRITARRKKTAAKLKETIEKELKELGIAHVQFECRLLATGFTSDGADDVEFYISPNAGEDLKPLAEIVSSGEAARVMLALKKALVNVDPVPVLIFDEIDAQIGGRLGIVTGKKLKELSRNRQVILITHLPQIASHGNRHFKVTKSVTGNRTTTRIEILEGDRRVKELAAMMGSEKKNETAIKHANEMLAKARR